MRKAALVYALLLIVACLLAPSLTVYDPVETNPASQLLPPSTQYWFGTDYLGRDIWSRFLYGGRITLVLSVTSAILALVPGILLGIIAGWWTYANRLISVFLYTLLAFPPLILALLVASLLPVTWLTIVTAVAVAQFSQIVVVVRSLVISVRSNEFLTAARALGAGEGHLLRWHLWPNVSPGVASYAGVVFAYCLLTISALGFLGVGLDQSIPEWGRMLAESRDVFRVSPWPALLPGAGIAGIVFALQSVTDRSA